MGLPRSARGFHKRTVAIEGEATKYQLYVPPSGVAEALPVILFLHGAGESGQDGVRQTTVGIGPAILRSPDRFPALVIFPQASHGYGWRGFNLAAAVAALDDVETEFGTDRNRVYVTGLSMGGFGTWLLCLQQPQRFAAAVPICGGLDRAGALHIPELGDTASRNMFAVAAQRVSRIPQWVFHGSADEIVPVEQSRLMVAALQKAGADVRFTEYPEVHHNSWDLAYAEPRLMPWLLAQRLDSFKS